MQSPASPPVDNAPGNWCSIAYFELDQQIGTTFQVPSNYNSVIVTGFVDQSGENRFWCYIEGYTSNIDNAEHIEIPRPPIRKGIQLELRDEGDVWLRCLSDDSLYFQSYWFDSGSDPKYNFNVHKTDPNDYVKIFDLREFELLLHREVGTAHDAATARAVRAAAVTGHITPNSFAIAPAVSLSTTPEINANDLKKYCLLRLSFVKSYGLDYPPNDIKETPCWIEVHFHKALQLLYKILNMPSHYNFVNPSAVIIGSGN